MSKPIVPAKKPSLGSALKQKAASTPGGTNSGIFFDISTYFACYIVYTLVIYYFVYIIFSCKATDYFISTFFLLQPIIFVFIIFFFSFFLFA